MPRTLIAILAGIAFLAVYLLAVLALADGAGGWHWSVQAAFFVTAGLAWVVPVRWLMLWAVRRRT